MIPEEALEKLHTSLKEDKERLEKKLKVFSDTDFGDSPGTDNEEADEAEEQVNRLGTINVLKKRLDGVMEAINRIESGTYGKCEKCGEEIGLELLSVDPESSYCKECKKDL